MLPRSFCSAPRRSHWGITCHVLAADPALQPLFAARAGRGGALGRGWGAAGFGLGRRRLGGLGFSTASTHPSTHPPGRTPPCCAGGAQACGPQGWGAARVPTGTRRDIPECGGRVGTHMLAKLCLRPGLCGRLPPPIYAAAAVARYIDKGVLEMSAIQELPQICSPILHRPRPPINDADKPTHPPSPAPPLTRRR